MTTFSLSPFHPNYPPRCFLEIRETGGSVITIPWEAAGFKDLISRRLASLCAKFRERELVLNLVLLRCCGDYYLVFREQQAMHVSDRHFARLRFTEASCKQRPSRCCSIARSSSVHVVELATPMFADLYEWIESEKFVSQPKEANRYFHSCRSPPTLFASRVK